jgi:CO/xanthine dehydrogenase Mo-binding subunit
VLEGDVDKALAEAEKVLEIEYTTDMVCHATMEPLNATVQFVDGAWHVYCGTQGPSSARLALVAYLSQVLGQKPEDIEVYVHESILGGAFGGKQTYDEILAAAYCVKEVSRPVKLIQTRESTFATSLPRTPTYHKLKDRLRARHVLGLLHGQAMAVAAVAEGKLLADVRVHHGRRGVAASELSAGRSRKSRLGREETAAQHRNGHCCLLRRGAAKPNVGCWHCLG